MKEYLFPVNGSVSVFAESYDEAVKQATEKVLKNDFEYEFGEETVFDLEEE
jgi:hypothetical protein